MTALDNVALAALVTGVPRQESYTKAYQLLRELGLPEKYDAQAASAFGRRTTARRHRARVDERSDGCAGQTNPRKSRCELGRRDNASLWQDPGREPPSSSQATDLESQPTIRDTRYFSSRRLFGGRFEPTQRGCAQVKRTHRWVWLADACVAVSWARHWTHVLTAGTMAIALFVFGALMLAQENLQSLLTGWGDQIQINTYLDKGLGAGRVSLLRDKIRVSLKWSGCDIFPEASLERFSGGPGCAL